ncbi:peptide ABC transporter permease [Williamsia sp. 1138]|nr:peptide ABC transporter permease [Williamsia sp. 1138]
MLSPGAASAEWTSEQIRDRHTQFRGDDSHTVGLTQLTDPASLDFSHVSEELQIAPTERIDIREIAARSKSAVPRDPKPQAQDKVRDARSFATTFPAHAPAEERGLHAYLSHTLALTGRQLRVVTRDRLTLIQSFINPLLSMIMFKVVLGDAVGQATGMNSAFGTVPLVILVGAMFGSLAVGTRLIGERRTGLLTRLYVMPVHRGADLSSRIGVEMMRIIASTLVLTTAGMLIGWRFNEGLLPALGIFAVALLYGAAYSTLVMTVAVSASNIPLVPIMSLFTSLMMFFNSGFSPVDAYPELIQPLVEYQPMTCAIDTMRALATGGPVAESFTLTVIWAISVIAVFAYPAARGYRKAAASRT